MINESVKGQPEPKLRSAEHRRVPPDRGIVLLDAKGRIGPKIWALYGNIDSPVILKDDKYVDNQHNPFYRDKHGHAFLLLPLIAEDDSNRYELADSVYRRCVGLGVIENPILFFTCVYQFDIPDYCCIAIHSSTGNDVLTEAKCHILLRFEQARIADQLESVLFRVDTDKKVRPVRTQNDVKLSPNLEFAVNMLVIHHGYSTEDLQALWDKKYLITS